MTIRTIFQKAQVVPVLTIEDDATAVDLARALVSGGLPVLEVTLRTRAALTAVQAIARAVPDAVVGVGTVIRLQDVRSAVDAGARFAVSPGLCEELARAASDAKLPYMPGVQTSSEIMTARRLGFTTLKFFPARPSGGVAALKAFAPVFPDVAFCPTGGVTAEDFRDYLRLENVIAVGGSWMVPPDIVRRRDWRAIGALARKAAGSLADA
jgi:2-dehydro-3-deoxyphosphogluconate aldolase/(4S)-4-hydroxy-2-oxoglutarate aldolase